MYLEKIELEDQLIFTESYRFNEIQAILVSDNRLWIVKGVDSKYLENDPDRVKRRGFPFNEGVKDYALSDISKIKLSTSDNFVNIKVGKKNIEIKFHEFCEAKNFVEHLTCKLSFSETKRKQSKILNNLDSIGIILFTIIFNIGFQTTSKEELVIELMNETGDRKGINFFIFLHDTFGYTGMIILGCVIVACFAFRIYKKVQKDDYNIVCEKP